MAGVYAPAFLCGKEISGLAAGSFPFNGCADKAVTANAVFIQRIIWLRFIIFIKTRLTSGIVSLYNQDDT